MMVKDIFKSIAGLNVLVVGDLMLDAYLQGLTTRISPEAPVPVVVLQNKDFRAGGAANVALNCQRLGATVAVAGLVGEDAEGKQLLSIMQKEKLDTDLIQSTSERKTTTKTRVLSRSQQVLRFDWEDASPIKLKLEHAFIDSILKYLQIKKPDIVILEDYNKGLLTENVIQQVLNHCRILNIPVAVDPKQQHFLAFKEATIFKPNLNEIQDGLGIILDPLNEDNLRKAHQILSDKLAHEISLITLSEKGIFYQKDNESKWYPSFERRISDVSGAGDTVIAVAALVYVATGDLELMAKWANLAGGLVCQSSGVMPINKKELELEINYKLS